MQFVKNKFLDFLIHLPFMIIGIPIMLFLQVKYYLKHTKKQ